VGSAERFLGAEMTMSCKVAVCLAMMAMVEANGRFQLRSFSSAASQHVLPGEGQREESRLGEELFRYGILRGETHAKAGKDFGPAMTKDLGTVPWYGFGGVDLDRDAAGTALFKRVLAAPPHLLPIYYEAFLAGYKLGHILDLPKGRQIALMSLDNLLRLGAALTSYAAEGGGKLPSMKDVPALRGALGPLVRASDFVNPLTNMPYKLNISLSGKNWFDLKVHARRTVAIYEATVAPDGTRGVMFVTGEARRVPEREWLRAKRASGIP
jgi:hypothetical protein